MNITCWTEGNEDGHDRGQKKERIMSFEESLTKG